jgi:hypothetical protein
MTELHPPPPKPPAPRQSRPPAPGVAAKSNFLSVMANPRSSSLSVSRSEMYSRSRALKPHREGLRPWRRHVSALLLGRERRYCS